MGTPTLTLMFDRRKRASKTKEGSIELRITFNRVKRYATTGVRVFPREWKNGTIVNRLDAYELQRTLEQFVAHARKVINNLMERGELDMQTIVTIIGGKQKEVATRNVPKERLLLDFGDNTSVYAIVGEEEGHAEIGAVMVTLFIQH